MGYVVPEPPWNFVLGERHCPICGLNNIERVWVYGFWQAQGIMRCKDCGFKSDARRFYRPNSFGTLLIFDEVELP